jgi:hypothetical protein
MPARGPRLDSQRWASKQGIKLPTEGRVAYLDLGGELADELASVRIVDAKGRQVPYIVESQPRQSRRSLLHWQRVVDTKTVVTATGLAGKRIASLEFSVSGPQYFMRQVSVFEETTDARGATGKRLLGSAHWTRQPDEPPQPLRVPVTLPEQEKLVVEIDNEDNPPLRVTGVVAIAELRRIDFPFSSGESLWLLATNPNARAPHYDLALVADAVLSSPALPARLEAWKGPREPELATPQWFWIALVVAGALVVAALARVVLGAKKA